MITCIIIEDQEPARRILRKYLNETPDLKLEGEFTNALDALEYFKSNATDLIFLDIHLPKLSGIDFMGVLSPKPQIILTTAFSEYALKSYDYDVTDYLLKPFSFERFIQAIYKVKKRMGVSKTEAETNEEENSKSILIKSGYDYIKIAFDDILFIKSDGDYTQLYTKQGKIMVSHSLKYWQYQLPNDRFYQVHRSYIVNTKMIDKATLSKIFINDKIIPIGRVFKKDFFDFYEEG